MNHLGWAACVTLTIVAIALCDVAWRRVPNELVGLAMVEACCLHAMRGLAPSCFLSFCLALAIAAVLCAGYANGLLGAADVKVAFACSLMLEPKKLWVFVGQSTLSCLLLCICWLAVETQGSPAEAWARLRRPQGALDRARLGGMSVPLTVCLGAAALSAL